SLPRAAFYPEKPLSAADSILVLLGKEAIPFLRCPAAGPDFDTMGWPGYIWNDALSGKKLAGIENPKETWMLMDFSAPHPWLVGRKNAGHRGGINILYVDGRVEWLAADEVGKRYPFKVLK
ncbi:MAG: hypothetical protein Q8O57_10545, partial [Kiritimatiellota bacterium]|nr:hypothetical protein [Kiritimatiellota bacterium]